MIQNLLLETTRQPPGWGLSLLYGRCGKPSLSDTFWTSARLAYLMIAACLAILDVHHSCGLPDAWLGRECPVVNGCSSN